EKNLRGNGAKANGLQENDPRLKQLPRKKDVRGKSFFLRKVQQEQEKKLRVGRPSKQKKGAALPSTIAIVILVGMSMGIAAYQTYRMWPRVFTFAANLVSSSPATIGEPGGIVPRVEALRYYLEIAPSNDVAGKKAVLANGLG